MEKQTIPKLRFPDFDEKWKEKRLDKLFSEFKSGKNIVASQIENEGLYPVFGGNGLRGYFNEYTHDGSYFLIGRQGALCGNVKISEGKAFFSEHAIACKANNDNNTFWLAQRIEYLKLNRLSESSAQPGLSVGKLLRLKLFVPHLFEQQKTASFLTSIDTKITQLTKKKSLVEQYKKGVMQKIFSQEIRFKDDKGKEYSEWKEKKLSDLGITLNGLTGKTKENFGSGKPYIQYKQIFDSSKINVKNCGFVEITSSDNQTKAQYGDAFFTTSSETPNEIGTASVLLDEVDEMYLNSFCFGFRVKQTLLYPSFSQFLFRSNDFRKKMIPLAQGSTRYNISKSSFLKLKVYLPPTEEQNKIADFLSAIDDKIEVLNNLIEKTATFKKGLLQQMFV